jgi:TPR repeat protein
LEKIAVRTNARAGDRTALTSTGLLYNNGQGVSQDFAEARRWYEKAASAGEATAMVNLGVLYLNGQGVPQNVVEAQRWFERLRELRRPETNRFNHNDGCTYDSCAYSRDRAA